MQVSGEEVLHETMRCGVAYCFGDAIVCREVGGVTAKGAYLNVIVEGASAMVTFEEVHNS